MNNEAHTTDSDADVEFFEMLDALDAAEEDALGIILAYGDAPGGQCW
jgi:hypothetical protein